MKEKKRKTLHAAFQFRSTRASGGGEGTVDLLIRLAASAAN